MAEQYCLKWNNHQSTLLVQFETLLESDTLTDCTLSADGKYLNVHKVLLSACSPYFSKLLGEHKDKHPIFFMKDVAYDELKGIVEYMYKGEVNVTQERLDSFLKTASSLQIKGLADSDGKGSDDGSDTGGGGNRSKRKTAPDWRGGSGYDSAPAPEEQSPRSPKRRRRPRPVSQEDSPLPPADQNHCDTSSTFAGQISQPPPADIVMPTPMLPVRKTEPLDNSTVHLKTELPDDAPQVDVQDLTLDDDEEFNEDVTTQPGTSFSESSQDFKWFQQQMAANQQGGTMDEQFLSSTPAQQNVNQSPGTQGDKQTDKPGYRCKCGKQFLNVNHFSYHVLKHCGLKGTPGKKLPEEKKKDSENTKSECSESENTRKKANNESTRPTDVSNKWSKEGKTVDSSDLINKSDPLTRQSDHPKQTDRGDTRVGLTKAEPVSSCRRSIDLFDLPVEGQRISTSKEANVTPSESESRKQYHRSDSSNVPVTTISGSLIIKTENICNEQENSHAVSNIIKHRRISNEVSMTPVALPERNPENRIDIARVDSIQKRTVNVVEITKLMNVNVEKNTAKVQGLMINPSSSVNNQPKSKDIETVNKLRDLNKKQIISSTEIPKSSDISSLLVTKEKKLENVKSKDSEIKKSVINVVELSKISSSSKNDTSVNSQTKVTDSVVGSKEEINCSGISIISVTSLSETDFQNINKSKNSNENRDSSGKSESEVRSDKSDKGNNIEIVSLIDEDTKAAETSVRDTNRDKNSHKSKKGHHYKEKGSKKKKHPNQDRERRRNNFRGHNSRSRGYSRSSDRYHYYNTHKEDVHATGGPSGECGAVPIEGGSRNSSQAKRNYIRKERFILPKERGDHRFKDQTKHLTKINHPSHKQREERNQPSLLMHPSQQTVVSVVQQNESAVHIHRQSITVHQGQFQGGTRESHQPLVNPQIGPSVHQQPVQPVQIHDLTRTQSTSSASSLPAEDRTKKRPSWHIPTTNY